MPWSASKPPKPSNKNTAAADKDLAVDRTADWARADNLAKSLVSQSADPDDVFCPLAEQQTCKLSEIFSAPRHREREPGSADWTPLSVLAGATPAGQAGTKIQLVGIDGEYSGETVLLPLESGSSSGTFVIGRSSSCNVTLSRDDQISRRHVEVQAREGKLFIRDLGSTYGTKLNGLALGDHVEQVRPGDTVTMGTSSFRLQTLYSVASQVPGLRGIYDSALLERPCWIPFLTCSYSLHRSCRENTRSSFYRRSSLELMFGSFMYSSCTRGQGQRDPGIVI
eukprot:scaffold144660_cov28-Tisochrysis_lutea.AAC.2